jgi:hypothetical protein
MISEANRRAIEAAGLPFILGTKFTHVPNEVLEWRKAHPDTEIPGTCSPNRGRPARARPAATRSSTTTTGLTGPAAAARH